MTVQPFSQKGCEVPSLYRYTWPGKDEAGICLPHAEWMTQVAKAMGLHLQLIPLVEFNGEQTCRVCSCTDSDCAQCIEKTGEPCHWIDEDLCSACEWAAGAV